MVMFSGRRNKTAGKNKKSRVGFFKRTALLAAVFALVFNVTVGPLVANVSAAAIDASINAKAAQAEAVNTAKQGGSIAGAMVSSVTGQFGLFGLDEIIGTITGFFDAVGYFLDAITNLAGCVAQFVKASPTSLPLAIIGCPMIGMVKMIMDFTQAIFNGILAVDIFYNSGGGSNILKEITNSFTTVANLIFAIIFLAIIAATAFGAGASGGEGKGALSNYGIKKMMPKLLIMAVAINTSFYICAALTDLSNIIAHGIGPMVHNSLTAANKTFLKDTFNLDKFGDNASDIVSSIMADTDVVAVDLLSGPLAVSLAPGLVIISLVAMTVLSIVAIVQIITSIILMGIRNTILVTLVVVSPIAWALGILPNTSKVFEKWLHYFGQMLMIYPAVMLMFAAAQITAAIMQAAPIPAMIKFPMIMSVMVSPLFYIKKIMKSTSSLVAAGSKAMGNAVKTTAKVGVAVGGVAATVATGGAAAPALLGAVSRIAPAAGKALSGGVNVAKTAASRGMGNKGGFMGKIGKLGEGIAKSEAKGEAIASADAQALNRIKGGGNVTAADHAKMVGANKAGAASAAHEAEVKVAKAEIQSANLPSDALKGLARGQDAGGVQATAANIQAAQELAGSASLGNGLEDLLAMVKSTAGMSGGELRAQQAINSYAAEQAANSGAFTKKDVEDIRNGGGVDANGNDRDWSADGQRRTIAENATGTTADKYASASGGDRKAILDSINALAQSGNAADVNLAGRARGNIEQVEVHIRNNPTLAGKMNESDYKVTH